MDFIKDFDLLGMSAKEIPCITESGAPTSATEGAVGSFYMDTDTGDVYKCTAVSDGVYTWGEVGSSTSTVNGDMSEVNGKIDQLLQRTSFRIRNDSFTPTEHMTGEVSIGIPAGAKMIEIIANGTVSEGSNSLIPVKYMFASVHLGRNSAGTEKKGCIVEYSYSGQAGRSNLVFDATNGFTVTLSNSISFEKDIEYDWTAYYWDESVASSYPTDDVIGDIDSALDGILAIQNQLMGGGAV